MVHRSKQSTIGNRKEDRFDSDLMKMKINEDYKNAIEYEMKMK